MNDLTSDTEVLVIHVGKKINNCILPHLHKFQMSVGLQLKRENLQFFFLVKYKKKCSLTLGVEKNFLRFKGGKLCKSSFGKLDCFTFENLFLQKKVKREAPNC